MRTTLEHSQSIDKMDYNSFVLFIFIIHRILNCSMSVLNLPVALMVDECKNHAHFVIRCRYPLRLQRLKNPCERRFQSAKLFVLAVLRNAMTQSTVFNLILLYFMWRHCRVIDEFDRLGNGHRRILCSALLKISTIASLSPTQYPMRIDHYRVAGHFTSIGKNGCILIKQYACIDITCAVYAPQIHSIENIFNDFICKCSDWCRLTSPIHTFFSVCRSFSSIFNL